MTLITLPPNITPGGQILDTDEKTVYNVINGGIDATNITPGSLTGTAFAAGSISLTKLKQSSSSVGVQQAGASHFGGAYLTLPSSTMFFPALSTDSGAGTIASLGGWRLGGTATTGLIGGGAGTITMGGAGALGDTSTDFNFAGGVGSGGVNTVGCGFARVAANLTPQYILWLAVLNATNTATNQGFLTAFYLQASPPYDLGDGEVPLFVFALIGKDGHVCATYVGQEPPWATRPDLKLKMPVTFEEALDDPAKMQQYLDALDVHAQNRIGLSKLRERWHTTPDTATRDEVAKATAGLEAATWHKPPDTQEYKNRMMYKVPHPFVHNDLVNGGAYETSAPLTVVMLDPVSKNTHRLALLHESGENVNAMLHNKHVLISNTAIRRGGPTGVMVVSHEFKNSGGK